MKAFQHMNAGSIDEAIDALQTARGRAVLTAGGTDLLAVLKDRILPAYPELVVNLKTVPGLDYIREDAQGLKIGALTKLADIGASPLVLSGYQGLAQAALSVAAPEIRNMATLGGNLCQDVRCWYYRYPHHMGGRITCIRKGARSCPAVRGDSRYHAVMGGTKGCVAVLPSDMAVMLAALDARVKLVGPAGRRSVAVASFYNADGPMLNDFEIIKEIVIPAKAKAWRQGYLKYTLRDPVDFAVVSVAYAMAGEGAFCADARIVLGAVACGPVRVSIAEDAIRGKIVDAALAERAAGAAVEGARPLPKNAYKIDIAKTLVKRAILGGLNPVEMG